MFKLINGDSREILKTLDDKNIIIVTDPPFNIGKKYNTYKDNTNDYMNMLLNMFKNRKCVVIHYPERLHNLSLELGYPPTKVVSWCYNSNLPRQHRDIAFFNIEPNFSRS